MAKEGKYHLSVVLFTKYILDAYRPILVGNIPPLKFVGGPTKQVRSVNIQGSWDLDTSIAVVTAAGVPLEEALSDIRTNSMR